MDNAIFKLLPFLLFGLVGVLSILSKRKVNHDHDEPKHPFDMSREDIPTMPTVRSSQKPRENSELEKRRMKAKSESPKVFASLKEERASIAQPVAEKKYAVTNELDVEMNVVVENDLMRDFDIRKAVIYSEILKPKFDE